MKMVGHKTESIYRRYAIVDEVMLKEGAAKLQTLHEDQAPAAPVIPLTKVTRTKRVLAEGPCHQPVHRDRTAGGVLLRRRHRRAGQE